MAVTEKLMAQGSFNVALDLSLVPNSILNAIQPFDQIVITNNEVEAADRIDKVILPSAEYVGVIRTLSLEPESAYIEGAGLNFYLGDDENKGMPVTGVLKIVYPCNSKYIVESKSIKLYLNSCSSVRICSCGANGAVVSWNSTSTPIASAFNNPLFLLTPSLANTKR